MFLSTSRCTHVLCSALTWSVGSGSSNFFVSVTLMISQTTYFIFLLGRSGKPYPGQIAHERVCHYYSVGVQVTRPSFSACAARPPSPHAVLQQRVCRRVRTRERTTATLTWALSVVPSLTWAKTTTLCGTCFSLVSHVNCLRVVGEYSDHKLMILKTGKWKETGKILLLLLLSANEWWKSVVQLKEKQM